MPQHWPYTPKLCLCSQPALCLRASWAPAFAVWQLFKVAASISPLYKVWGLQNGRQPPELPLSQPASVFVPQRDRLSIWFPWTRRYFSSKNNYCCFLKQGLTMWQGRFLFKNYNITLFFSFPLFPPTLSMHLPHLSQIHGWFFLSCLYIHTFITKYINTASLVYIIWMRMISGMKIWY